MEGSSSSQEKLNASFRQKGLNHNLQQTLGSERRKGKTKLKKGGREGRSGEGKKEEKKEGKKAKGRNTKLC